MVREQGPERGLRRQQAGVVAVLVCEVRVPGERRDVVEVVQVVARQPRVEALSELEEAALLDGASRFQILKDILIPASVPALATLATFTFLYAWNSFFWPLVIINVGNEQNHVLTLALNVLRGRASDTPNLILAGAAIAIIPPLLVFIFGQRFFVESVASSGVKG